MFVVHFLNTFCYIFVEQIDVISVESRENILELSLPHIVTCSGLLKEWISNGIPTNI